MSEKGLYDKLIEYSKSDYYPFHMPGHKRNREMEGYSPYIYDITEIDGFDNLHSPEDIIKDRMDRAAKFYNAEKSYFLINGSTCGILAAISAAANIKKTDIIMGRNSHKAAYNAVFLNELSAEYIYPDNIAEYNISGGINPDDLKKILQEKKSKGSLYNTAAVYITSPTYEGIVSDIEKLAELSHSYGLPLIVDEAHGAHFGMYNITPASAVSLGADIVIQSLHKTLPALTQTAIIHVNKNSIIDVGILERYLAIYQTSSPSYVLMGSIDRCIDIMKKQGRKMLELLDKNINDFRDKARNLKNFVLLDKEIIGDNSVFDYDNGKIVIYSKNNDYTGKMLYDELLSRYHIQLEMTSLNYVIAMTSVMDTEQGFDRLMTALQEIDKRLSFSQNKEYNIVDKSFQGMSYPKVSMDISQAVSMSKKQVALEKSESKVSSEFVYVYPPGIPIVVPGEKYSREIIEYIGNCHRKGMNLKGVLIDNEKIYVNVIEE